MHLRQLLLKFRRLCREAVGLQRNFQHAPPIAFRTVANLTAVFVSERDQPGDGGFSLFHIHDRRFVLQRAENRIFIRCIFIFTKMHCSETVIHIDPFDKRKPLRPPHQCIHQFPLAGEHNRPETRQKSFADDLSDFTARMRGIVLSHILRMCRHQLRIQHQTRCPAHFVIGSVTLLALAVIIERFDADIVTACCVGNRKHHIHLPVHRLPDPFPAGVAHHSASFIRKDFFRRIVIHPQRSELQIFARIAHQFRGIRRFAGEHHVADTDHHRFTEEPHFFALLIEQHFGFAIDGENNVRAEADDEYEDDEKEDFKFEAVFHGRQNFPCANLSSIIFYLDKSQHFPFIPHSPGGNAGTIGNLERAVYFLCNCANTNLSLASTTGLRHR